MRHVQRFPKQRLVLVGVGVAATLFLAALMLGRGSDRSVESRHVWDLLGNAAGFHASETVQYSSMDDLIALSDAVIIGEVTGIEVRSVPTEDEGGGMAFARLNVRVRELLTGALPTEHRENLTVEVPKPALSSIDDLRAALTRQPTIFFLANGLARSERMGTTPSAPKERSYLAGTYAPAADAGVVVQDPDSLHQPLGGRGVVEDSPHHTLEDLADAIRSNQYKG